MCTHLWRDMGPGEASTAMIDEHTRPQRNGLDLKGQRNGSKPLASVASRRREQPVTAEGKEGKPLPGRDPNTFQPVSGTSNQQMNPPMEPRT